MRDIMRRFSLYMEIKGLNDNIVTLECGLSQGLLGQARRGKSDLGKKTIDKILNKYQDLNRIWLLTGEGDMISVKPRPPITLSSGGLRSHDYHTFLVPVTARAGALVDFQDGKIDINECERVVSPVGGADLAITVVGDSMYPRYPAGSYIFIKRINTDTFIEWGRSYVLDTSNGIIIREVQPGEDGGVMCHSINPSGQYRDFSLRQDDIRAMFKILATVNLG